MQHSLISIFMAFLFTLVSSPQAKAKPEANSVFCGFSENTDPPKKDIEFADPGTAGLQIVYKTKHGDELFVTVSTMPNLEDDKRTDLNLLILSSTAGGFFESQGRGLLRSKTKSNGVVTTIPQPRRDGGLYLVKIECSI